MSVKLYKKLPSSFPAWMYRFPFPPAVYGCCGFSISLPKLVQWHQALWMCPFEAVWVVVKSMDSGVRQPGFLTRLHPSTSCVTLADFPNHSVPQLSHLLNGNNINNNCLILLRLLCIYHNACHIAIILQMLVRTVIPSGCQEVFIVVFRGPLESPSPSASFMAHSQGPHG